MITSFLLVVALSLDSFLASLAYGAQKIRIPLRSTLLIALIGTSFLGVSIYTAGLFQKVLHPQYAAVFSFAIFFLMGVSALFQGTIKSFLKDRKSRKVPFQYSGISFVLDVYLDETRAGADHSKELSLHEALYLAVALSIDSIVSGFAYGVQVHDRLLVLCISFTVGFLAVFFGSYIGRHVASLADWNLSWVSGILFLLLAFMRIL